MCNPAFIAAIPYITAAVSAAAAVTGTVMAVNSANDTAEAQGKSAVSAAKSDYQQLLDRANQTNDAAAREKMQRQLQTARERGRIMVAQGQAGVGGNSSLALLNNAIIQERTDLDVVEANRRDSVSQINTTMQGVHAGASGRINEADASTTSPAMGYVQAGLNGTQAGMQGYESGRSLQKTIPKKIK